MPVRHHKVKTRSWRFRTAGPVRLLTFRAAAALLIVAPIATLVLVARQPARRDPQAELIEKGRRIFFNENLRRQRPHLRHSTPSPGRTTSPSRRAFIATPPKNDPLFVAEFVSWRWRRTSRTRSLMREFGLILRTWTGSATRTTSSVMRGVPHVLSLATRIDSPRGHTGWSGDGSPGDGSPRSFRHWCWGSSTSPRH